ncbi:hypothetical protein CDAR_544391 [Caerostris darwini]|uniref:Uncharacterized protein n=1 Tax=Caerostris darwini TaxID=1538125 RepID=A0AAV4RA51_9ARAC|nr:hypothetical protein CDAR_544391 [Caerostris darwini]
MVPPLVVVSGLICNCDQQSYIDGSLATGRVFQARQICGELPDEERYTDPPGLTTSKRYGTNKDLRDLAHGIF